MIKPLRWTGPSLYDLASDRLRACHPEPSNNGDAPRLRQFIDDAISDDYLKESPWATCGRPGTSSSSCTG